MVGLGPRLVDACVVGGDGVIGAGGGAFGGRPRFAQSLLALLRENDDRDVFLRHAGIMGLGEAATVATAAAVANAVYDAIGVQVTELPMTPARVLAALRGAAR